MFADVIRQQEIWFHPLVLDLVTPASPVARSESPSGQYAGPRIVLWLFCSVDHHSCCRYRSTGIS
ncbi:hypothetical protein F2Q69_00020129 [Brassica cretica]|uniref:Uncharacterized protein n=1 Tax=Brassica cretica TaxID=69181 RepID=A0A8S9QK04_BRACR|nr:hypothetical protein F2Q69_00020129 [Brassica cretica]